MEKAIWSSPGEAVIEDRHAHRLMHLEAENARLRITLEHARAGLAATGDTVVGTDAQGRIDFLNPAGERLCGFTLAELAGLPAEGVFTFRSAETNAPIANPVRRCLDHGHKVERRGRSLLIGRGGRGVMVQESAVPVTDAGGRIIGAVMVVRDLSLQTNLSESLLWQKKHDPLTGLVNREEFGRLLAREISLVRSSDGAGHCLMSLDLDRFRVINDTAGHAAGDRALLEVARLIQDKIRGSDLAARLGGDEFAILLRDCSMTAAVAVARELGETLEAHRFLWRHFYFQHTASIGVVEVDGTMDADTVLAAADVACYSAKDAGRNTVSFSANGETSSGYRDMQWVSVISRACDEGRFQLHCQPIVPVGRRSDPNPHFELLLRINDEDDQVIPAMDFLPAAERFNMMPTIDRWVLRYALDNLIRRRSDSDDPAYMLSVNLSGTSLSDQSFLDFAYAVLSRSEVAAGALCFEITETAAIDNIAAVARFIRKMRQLGCLFSLDDFGSGLSSFAYLKELPVDFLKIDGRFVRNVHEDAVDHTMVGAISHIGSALGVRTVAERVETHETLARLEALGVDYAQGYYFSRPLPVVDRDCIVRLLDTTPDKYAAQA